MLFYIEMLSPLYLNKKLDHLIMRYKEKSIFNFLNQDHHQIITQKFLQVLKKKKINEDLVYKFFVSKAKYL